MALTSAFARLYLLRPLAFTQQQQRVAAAAARSYSLRQSHLMSTRQRGWLAVTQLATRSILRMHPQHLRMHSHSHSILRV
jgi:hypothetical protein